MSAPLVRGDRDSGGSPRVVRLKSPRKVFARGWRWKMDGQGERRMRQFGTKTINSKHSTISNSFPASRRVRGEMNSHGKAGECGSRAVYRHHVAGVCRAGDGVFGVGGDGAGTLWLSLCLLVEAVSLGGRRSGGDGGGDGGGLPGLKESGAGVFG